MQRLKAFVKRHRILFALWVVIEIVSIPAAAQMMDRVSFTAGPIVIVADIPGTEAGLRSYLVSSNAPFAVEVGGVLGEVSVNVASSGYLGDLRYGENAQMPGVARACALGRIGTMEAYRAERKTAAVRGNVESQAVRVDVRFDDAATPDIRIVAVEDSVSLPGEVCPGLYG